MFTPDAQVLDFSAQDWLRLPDLFRDLFRKPLAPQLVVFWQGYRCVRMEN